MENVTSDVIMKVHSHLIIKIICMIAQSDEGSIDDDWGPTIIR